MLKLTREEQRMLEGKEGAFKQKALQKIVEYANALGAEELCTVTKATIYMGYHPYLDAVESEDYNEIFPRWCCAKRGTRSIRWSSSAANVLPRPVSVPVTISAMRRSIFPRKYSIRTGSFWT